MLSRRFQPVHRYVLAVCVAGVAALLSLSFYGDWREIDSPVFLLFAAFVLLGELLPIRVSRQGEQDEITTSTTFVFALLITKGPVAAAVAQIGASIVADIVNRKPAWKAAFNASQYTIAVSASAGILMLLTKLPHPGLAIGTAEVPPILLAGAVFFLTNTTLTAVALALAQGLPLVVYVQRDFAFQALTDGVLLALAPIVAIIAGTHLLLVPLLALPIVAVYKSASVSLVNAGLVQRLEESLSHLLDLNRRNEYQATHDILTDLPNRTLFRERLEQALLQGTKAGRSTVVMIIDLDRFKDINDTLGHQHGDMLLQQVGPRLKEVLGEGQMIARFGGDEFGVLLSEVDRDSSVPGFAERILAGLERPFPVGDLMLHVEASIGIASAPVNGSDAETLLRRAELAMYVAKGRRQGFQLYSPEYDEYTPSRLALLGNLRRAIKEEELILHYQPKAELRTRRLHSVEALVRWRHPERGLIPPSEFIPFAEHTTLISGLTLYILNRVLRQCHRWSEQGHEVTVSVNLSARNLLDPKLPEDIEGLLRKWRVGPEHLELEITESTILVDPVRALDVLSRLAAMGIEISLDDFGTGYSSLAYLRRLPVHEIKIDKSFVMNMDDDESDAKIVKSTIDLGRNLGLRVVAEGVESADVWEQLGALECDLGQGYYVSPPLPPDELTEWLRRATRPAATGNGRVLVQEATSGSPA